LGLTKAPYSYQVTGFTMCDHSSTHVDAINHVVSEPGGRSVDVLPLELVHGAGRLVRLFLEGAKRLHHPRRRCSSGRADRGTSPTGVGGAVLHRLVSQVSLPLRVHPRLPGAGPSGN